MSMSLAVCTITARRPQWFEWWKWNLLKQSLQPDEVVVVDDGSWPDSPGVRRFTVPGDWTTGRKRLQAVRLARSEYVVFIDDDDWYSPRAFSTLWRARGPGVTGIQRLIWYAPRLNRFGVEYTGFTHHPFIVSRQTALQVGWPDMMDGEDLAFYRACPSIQRLPDALYIGIQHGQNVFNRDTRLISPLPREDAERVLGDERCEFHTRLSALIPAENRSGGTDSHG